MPEGKARGREILATIGSFLSTFITTVIVLVAAAFLIVRLLGWGLYSIDSYSMTPTYPVDTLVVVQPVDGEDIEIGDVITFILNEEGTMVTHRVTGINSLNRTFTTKGDANETDDASPVIWDNVAGRVVFGIPVAGKVLRVLTADENRPIVIGVICGLLALSVIWDIISAQRKKKQRLEEPEEIETHTGKHLAPTENRRGGAK